MKYILLLFVLATTVGSSGELFAQQSAEPQGPLIELTPDELKVVIHKLAELRRRRYLLWQQQQAMAARRRAATAPRRADNIQTREVQVLIKEDAAGRVDTLISVAEGRLTGDGVISRLDVSSPPAGTPSPAPEAKPQRIVVDNSAELAELRRRLDRQEELLLDIRDRPYATSIAPATAPTPTPGRTDTIIQQIMLNTGTDGTASLSKADLRELTLEVGQMNREISNLRSRLAYEEDRRRRAERDMERALERSNRDRTVVVSPTVTEQSPQVVIVRDTVFVDRVSTTPVFIPTETKPDTVIMIRESAPTVVKDTVVVERESTVIRDREVIKTDTLKMKAVEPISFPTIFFDNNSSSLNTTHRNLLATVVGELSGKTGYAIRLTGYASPSGNAAYNQALSLKRAAAVRQGLEAAGLRSDQIYTVPGGIDYQPTSAAAARRVEIQAIPK